MQRKSCCIRRIWSLSKRITDHCIFCIKLLWRIRKLRSSNVCRQWFDVFISNILAQRKVEKDSRNTEDSKNSWMIRHLVDIFFYLKIILHIIYYILYILLLLYIIKTHSSMGFWDAFSCSSYWILFFSSSIYYLSLSFFSNCFYYSLLKSNSSSCFLNFSI